MKAYPSFKEFRQCRLLLNRKKEQKPLWLLIALYPFALIGITIFWIFMAITITMIMGSVRNNTRRKYPREKYRKVVKEGILWDTVEWHER